MKLLLFSRDEYFVQVFSKYISIRQPDFELLCYTKEEAAKAELQREKITAVLSEEGYLEEAAFKSAYITLGTATVMPKENGKGALNIYQKASQMLEDLEHILSTVCGEKTEADRVGKLVGFYSTEGGAGKTTISYLTATLCAKKRKTVYWNLEALAITKPLYQQEFSHSMEELLFAKESGSGLQELLYETVVRNQDGVYVLPDIKSLGDYRDISAQTIKEICEKLFANGMELIILDLPTGYTKEAETLLTECNHLVWVYSGTAMGRQKEEALKADPYLRAFMRKSSFVINRLENKAEAEGEIAFPYSATMQKAALIAKVMEVNQEFVKGCQALENAIFNS